MQALFSCYKNTGDTKSLPSSILPVNIKEILAKRNFVINLERNGQIRFITTITGFLYQGIMFKNIKYADTCSNYEHQLIYSVKSIS